MAQLVHNRPLGFFDLPREIRDDIYTRMMCFPNDGTEIRLGRKGTIPNSLGQPDRRARLYECYQEFVLLFTISHQFCNEALPIFWQENTFELSPSFSRASFEQADTALNFIGPAARLYIARVSLRLYCTVFVRKTRCSQENEGYDTDLGTSIKGLLDILPNLQWLNLTLNCTVQTRIYPGEKETEDVLQKAAEGVLELLRPLECFQSSEKRKLEITVFGDVRGRPIRTSKVQDSSVLQ